MKSAIVLLLVVIVGGGVLYGLSSTDSFDLPTVVLSGDRAYLRDGTLVFLEDIKFKDFDKASTYHLKEAQKVRDIPGLIRRVFRIKHEVLDIQSYEVLEVELDKAKARGRVRTMIRYHVLGDRKVRDNEDSHRSNELMFYWFKQPDGTWVMELESSLR